MGIEVLNCESLFERMIFFLFRKSKRTIFNRTFNLSGFLNCEFRESKNRFLIIQNENFLNFFPTTDLLLILLLLLL